MDASCFRSITKKKKKTIQCFPADNDDGICPPGGPSRRSSRRVNTDDVWTAGRTAPAVPTGAAAMLFDQLDFGNGNLILPIHSRPKNRGLLLMFYICSA